jgi:NYN domain
LDRCALFVDAGYALGDGALAVHGTRHRDSVSWDYAGLLKLLGGLARDRAGLPLLRCYWYDVAAAGSRAAEHDSLADVPGVKLRLSKARPSRKEGVEAEMRKDLTALARNHAVSDVVIVSAEEDLAPAIAEVQEFGVRAVLLYIGADGNSAGSRALRQECDDVIEVSAGHLRPFAELIVGAEPQPGGAGYGDQLVGSSALGAPRPVIDSAGPRLYASPVTAGYEQAARLTAVGGQRDDQRDLVGSADVASFGAAPPGDIARAGSVQPGPDGPQPQPNPLAPAAHYQQPAEVLAAGLPGAGETGYGQVTFGGQHATLPANGHGGSGQQGVALSHQPGQASAGAPGLGNGVAADRLPGPAAGGVPARPMPAGALPIGGPAENGVPGIGPESVNGVPGMSGRPGLPHSGVASSGPSQPGPPGDQTGGALGQQQGFLPAGQGVPGPQLAPQPQDAGRQQLAPPPQPGLGHQQLAPPPQPGLGHQQLAPPPPQPGLGQQQVAPPPQQQGLGEQPMAQPVQSLAVQPGGPRHAGAPGGPQGQNGLMPLDLQRPPLPGRQLPAGNGLPYGQDQRLPYAGQLQQSQFGGSTGQPYPPGGYGGQPAQLPAPGLSVGDAVQSAHAEGFGFGEAVARDAPALWLEAVLARKPRMPSDLEARLLQGSALPIDSLLHDEVRHALRRGFWDALERSRH